MVDYYRGAATFDYSRWYPSIYQDTDSVVLPEEKVEVIVSVTVEGKL